jgi:hypothetical protein
MKKILLVAALMACVGAMAQGTVNFKNSITGEFSAPVYNVDGVTKLSGDTFFAQLYALQGGSFLPIGAPTKFLLNGIASGGETTVPAAAIVGGVATLQMRAWQVATAGTAGTYDLAVGAGMKAGISASFTVSPTAPASPPGLPADLVNLTSFSITGVPEPTTIALGMIGAAALLLRRRK